MRGGSRTDFLETTKLPETNGGNLIVYVLISFHSRDERPCFRLFCARLVSVHNGRRGRLFGFRELNKANFNGNVNEYNGRVSVRYYTLRPCPH